MFLATQGQSESPAPGAMKRIEEGQFMIAFDVHLVQFIQALRALPTGLFERYIPWSFGLLTKLIRVQNLDLREVVMEVMNSKVKVLVCAGCVRHWSIAAFRGAAKFERAGRSLVASYRFQIEIERR